MANRLHHKFSRVMHSFQFCRPKRPSIFPDSRKRERNTPTPIIPKAFDINYPNFPATPERSFSGQISSQIASIGCRCKSTSCSLYFPKDLCSVKSPVSCKEIEMHVAPLGVGTKSRRRTNGGDELLSGEFDSYVSPLPMERKKNRKNNKKVREGIRADTSSLSSRWSVGYEGDEESKNSFSNEFSYELIDPATPMIEKPNEGTSINKKKMKNTKSSGEVEECGGMRTGSGMWQMMPCSGNEKVRESYVMVKKTEEPYEEFKRSMMEMILEKEIFQTEGLEELLQWFLTLNSRQYHGIIVKAFSEIWDVLFCDSLVQE